MNQFTERFEQAKSLGLTVEQMKANLEQNIVRTRESLRDCMSHRHCYGGSWHVNRAKRDIQALREVDSFRVFLSTVGAA